MRGVQGAVRWQCIGEQQRRHNLTLGRQACEQSTSHNQQQQQQQHHTASTTTGSLQDHQQQAGSEAPV